MEVEGFEAGGLGVGFGGYGVGIGFAVLVDGEVKGSGIDGFEGGGDFDGRWLGLGFPVGFDWLAGGVDA